MVEEKASAAPKRKRGRPRKVKPDAEAKAAEVLASLDAKLDAELVKDKVTFEDEGAGKEAIQHSVAADDTKQEDYLPGTRVRDILAVPEFVWDDDRQMKRRASSPKEYHYCWVEGTDITRFKMMGYRLCMYRGGRGLSEYGFSGTYLYECDASGHVRLGDVYLMYCDHGLYEALAAEDRMEADRMSRIGETNFHNTGYQYGIRTFSEMPDGSQAHN